MLKILKKGVLILALGLLIWFLVSQAQAVEQVALTINVANDSEPSAVIDLLEVLDRQEVSATFFLVGEWAQQHENLTRRIAQKHEIGCHTMSEARLAQLNESGLTKEIIECKEVLENISGSLIVGFRAPSNDVNKKSFALIAQEYKYDSSLYRRYEWFWEKPPAELVEIPVSSLLLLPLEDTYGIRWFRLGDSFFWLTRRAKQDTIVIAVTPKTIHEYLLDLEFLLAHYEREGASLITLQEVVE